MNLGRDSGRILPGAGTYSYAEHMGGKSYERQFPPGHAFNPEMVAAMAAGAVYAKAFLETVAKHHAEALIGTLFRRPRSDDEVLVGPKNGKAATIVVTGDLPDEARLALLDLDVTAEELRGKELVWDESAGAWRPSDPAKPGEAASTS
jgi:hypothetical protein